MQPLIDIHAHVLPDVDDGARDLEESFRLLIRAAEQGITQVIATPHYHRSRGNLGYEELRTTLEAKVRQEIPGFHLYLGQETYYHEGLTESLRQGKALTMAGSRYVLVEFDPGVPYGMLHRGLRQLLLAGYTPVLAHMERYGCLRQDANLKDLSGSGCVLQMNYDSLRGSPFKRDVRWCRKRVLAGDIGLLGTDMHRLDFRPPEVTEAAAWVSRHGGDGLLRRMAFTNPRCIIENKLMS